MLFRSPAGRQAITAEARRTQLGEDTALGWTGGEHRQEHTLHGVCVYLDCGCSEALAAERLQKGAGCPRVPEGRRRCADFFEVTGTS